MLIEPYIAGKQGKSSSQTVIERGNTGVKGEGALTHTPTKICSKRREKGEICPKRE